MATISLIVLDMPNALLGNAEFVKTVLYANKVLPVSQSIT